MASFIVCTDKHDILNSFNSLSIKELPCVKAVYYPTDMTNDFHVIFFTDALIKN